jgi:myo-inositol-1(or 4)-monophosphatase
MPENIRDIQGKLPTPAQGRKMPSANDLVHIARTAAEQAGAYLRSVVSPPDPTAWNAKGRADWATEVDRNSEAIIAESLHGAMPGTPIVGEELSPEIVTAGLVWIVDPLDGTTNFLHNFPAFAVSIAAAVDGILQAGVVLHVPLNRLSQATRDGGAWENGNRLSVSRITDPTHSLIGTGVPFKDFSRFDEYLAQLGRITRGATGVRRPGSASLDLTDVAAGRYDGFWEQRLAPWDVAAGTLLVREAGGLVTDYSGRDIGIEHGEIAAGNPAIHRWLLDMLASQS